MAEPSINTVKQLVDLSKDLRKTTSNLRQLCGAASVEELEVARMFFADGVLIPGEGENHVRPTVS